MSGFFVAALDRRELPLVRQAHAVAEARGKADQLIDEARLRQASLVVLETCERLEVYTDGTMALSVRRALRWLAAPMRWLAHADAARHAFRVASGVESRILGEPHVLGQVRRAVEDAVAGGTCDGDVRRTLERAVRCGRRVQREVRFAADRAGYAGACARIIEERFAPPSQIRAALVGTGVLARSVAAELSRLPRLELTVVGRHAERAAALARAVGARTAGFEAFVVGDIDADAVVCAIDPSRPVVTRRALRRSGAALVVDLGALPAVADGRSGDSRIEVVRLEDFAPPNGDRSAAEAAARIVEAELHHHFQTTGVVVPRLPRIRSVRARGAPIWTRSR